MEKGFEDWDFRIQAREIKLQQLSKQDMIWILLDLKQKGKLNCSRGSQKNQQGKWDLRTPETR